MIIFKMHQRLVPLYLRYRFYPVLLGIWFLAEASYGCSDNPAIVGDGGTREDNIADLSGPEKPGIFPDGFLTDSFPGEKQNRNDALQQGDALNLRCVPSLTLIDQVDPTRILADLKALTEFPERRSLQGQQKALAYLNQHLSGSSDLQLKMQTYTYRGASYSNIEATIIGNEQADEYVFASAHYDSTSSDPSLAPGADDNASGTTAVLEAARVLAGCHPRRSIRLLFFSNEEAGAIGSQNYVASIKSTLPPHKVVGVINLDMVGYASDTEDLDLATRPAYGALVQQIKPIVEQWTFLKAKTIINDQCG